MNLLPGLQDALQAMAAMGSPPEGLSTAEQRAWLHARIDETFTANNEDRAPVASEVDHLIPVDGGEITGRVYRPDLDGELPCYLYLHGGGFWLGALDAGDSICRGIATDAECVVVNLDYRLAPEHRFPIAAEDTYASLLWIVDQYLARPEDATNPYASPLLAPDLTGLPPALVMSAEFDQLRVEDAEYAERLRAAGVAVEERCWEGQFHGSMQLAKLIPDEARAYHEQVVAALCRAYASG